MAYFSPARRLRKRIAQIANDVYGQDIGGYPTSLPRMGMARVLAPIFYGSARVGVGTQGANVLKRVLPTRWLDRIMARVSDPANPLRVFQRRCGGDASGVPDACGFVG